MSAFAFKIRSVTIELWQRSLVSLAGLAVAGLLGPALHAQSSSVGESFYFDSSNSASRKTDALLLEPSNDMPIASSEAKQVVENNEESWPFEKPDYDVGYKPDKGLFIKSTALDERPFSVFVGGRLQVKYAGFARSRDFWTDNAGVTRDIQNQNKFKVERARLNISGTAIDPRLSYLMILDGDGDEGGNADILGYIATFAFNDRAKLRAGRWKTSASRQWLLSSRFQRMVDRSVATEFFRPSFSEGLWLLGDLNDRWNYELSLTDGFRTSRRRAVQLDGNFATSGMLRFEPLGDYGKSDVDFQNHVSPVVRLGSSFAIGKTDGGSASDRIPGLGDEDFLRLTDGTRIADENSLAAGATLTSVQQYLLACDLGWKHRGWSLSAECYLRWLQDFEATGPLPIQKLFARGYYAELGKFLIPQKLDINGRISQVFGLYGDGSEYSLGSNWYWADDEINKLSLDVSRVYDNPVNAGNLNLAAGDDGVLLRLQVQVGW